MAAEFSELLDPLLDWVYQQTGGNPLDDAEVLPFAQEHGLDLQQAFALVQYAKGKGVVDDSRNTMGMACALLTPYGFEVIEQRRRRIASPVARAVAARRGLLCWMWHQQNEGVRQPVLEKVLQAPESLFEGTRLTDKEIDLAAAHLQAKSLISGPKPPWGRKGPIRAKITAEGEDCVENFDGDPAAYGRHHGGTTYNTFLPNAQGVIVGEQQNFTQNNTAGIDPSAFVQLAGYVGQISSTLGMPQPQREELERAALELHAEATADAPQGSRLREVATRVRDALVSAGTTMAAQVGVQMAEQALQSLT
jgi:hypothetical protein